MKKYKIGVNGRYFTQPFVGMGRYSLSIFEEMARSFPEFQFEIAITEALDHDIDKNFRYLDNLRFEIIAEKPLLKRIHKGLAKSYWEKIQLKRFFLGKKVQLIHIPYPALYKSLDNVPVVVTAHDSIMWTDSEYLSRGWLSSVYNQETLKATQKADLILTVSERSKVELSEIKGFLVDKIRVVYNASEFSDKPKFEENQEKEILKRLGINGKYLFYMGGYDKRKNVERLVEIFTKEIGPMTDCKLVLGGGKALKNKLFQLRKWSNEELQFLVETGFVSNQELLILYRNALGYFSISRREGFNLPLLEALSLATPAFVSDLAVHREVAGDLPFYLDLEKTNRELGQQIVNLLNSKSQYNELKAKTLAGAEKLTKKFSWHQSALQIGEIYKQLLENAN